MLKRLCAGTSRILLVLSFALPVASAQSPSTVSVRAEFVFPRYHDDFEDPQAVEAAAAKLFADYLNREVGFLRFVAGDTTSPYHLVFEFDRSERQGTVSPFAQLGFWVRLDLPGGQVLKYWLKFREGTLSATPSPEVFQDELITRLAHADPKMLREEIFRDVPMTEVALPSRSPLGWALPFRQLDVCMKNQSVLTIVNDLQSQEQQVTANVTGAFHTQGTPSAEQQPFDGGMFATNLNLPIILANSINDGTLRVKRVLVTTYIHDASACSHRIGSDGAGGAP